MSEAQFYRLYRLDRSGGILDAEIVAAENDAMALVEARRLQQGDPVELWDRSRRVAVLGAVSVVA